MNRIQLFVVSVSLIFISRFLYAMESNNIPHRSLRVTLTTEETIGVSEADVFKRLFIQQKPPVKQLFFNTLQEHELLSCAEELYRDITVTGYFVDINRLCVMRSIPVMEYQQKINFVVAWKKTANAMCASPTMFPVWQEFETLIMGELPKKKLLLQQIEDSLFIKSIEHLSVVCELIKKHDEITENIVSAKKPSPCIVH